jgi:hypothetical protein
VESVGVAVGVGEGGHRLATWCLTMVRLNIFCQAVSSLHLLELRCVRASVCVCVCVIVCVCVCEAND